jgi:CRP-like cAMP-binding protein
VIVGFGEPCDQSVMFKSRQSHTRQSLFGLGLSDAVSLVGAFVSVAFVVLAASLLVKYRQVSSEANASVELGKDLLDAMQSRLRKQDERILDVMTRLDVIQLRTPAKARAQVTGEPTVTPEKVTPAQVTAEVESTPTQLAQESPEVTALRLLDRGPHTSNEVNAVLGKSREHAARLMKGLFAKGFVSRDDSKRPFVYQITDEGRRHLSAS